MLYAKSTSGFYDRAIHGANVPADAVEITAEEHRALLAGESAGKRIVSDAGGNPVLQEAPKATAPQVWERIKSERDRRIQSGGYKAGGVKWFHSDTFSRSQQLGLARKADRIDAAAGDLDAVMLDAFGAPIAWKTMDASFVPVTARLAQQITAAAEAADLATFKAAELHRIAMEASADPSTYDFSAGWPAIYEPAA